MKVLSRLQNSVKINGTSFILLIDPDKKNNDKIEKLVEHANINDVDAIFIGGSLMMDSLYHERIARIKSISNIPLVLFPGGINQINRHFDAMLFMSLISGRNPHYLIGEQVLAAPIIKDLGIETISTGYILIDGGSSTTVEFISGTKPLPTSRIDLIMSHVLAAQFLGMKFLYLEAGSGAKKRVPNEVVEMVAKESQLDLIVGGGIKTPKDANELAQSGASFVVVGSAIENSIELMNDFSSAIHD